MANQTQSSLFNPIPSYAIENFVDIPLWEKMQNTYHFWAGYIGTLDRLKIGGGIAADYRKNTAEYIAIGKKFHAGIFDYLTLFIPFGSTLFSMKTDGNGNLLGNGDGPEGNYFATLIMSFSGIAALPRILFGFVMTAISSPFVALAHYVAKVIAVTQKPAEVTLEGDGQEKSNTSASALVMLGWEAVSPRPAEGSMFSDLGRTKVLTRVGTETSSEFEPENISIGNLISLETEPALEGEGNLLTF